MPYYYVGNKADLCLEVIEETYERIRVLVRPCAPRVLVNLTGACGNS